MPQVLVDGATLKCTHAGVLSLSGGNAKLSVDGKGAITAGMEVGLSFAMGKPGVIVPCPVKDPKSGAPTPCHIDAPATAGISALLEVDAAGVLLDNAQGPALNDSTGPAPWSVADAGQAALSVDR